MSKKNDDKQNVIVVGGGWAGLAIARSLSAQLDPSVYNLLLINSRPYSITLPAIVRLAVSPRDNLEESVFVPYDKLFHKNNGEFILDSVVSIEQSPGQQGGVVVLQSGQKIPYHILVLSPGSVWSGPIGFPANADEVPEFIRKQQTDFKNANDIVLVGGGAVGIEIAGEVKDLWPEKKVTIVHGELQLLNGTYPDKFRRAAEKSVTSRGVQLVLDDRVDQQAPVGGLVTTRKGQSLSADLVVQAYGSRPNTGFVATLAPDVLTARGFVKIKPTLQLAAYPDIFAAGDVIDWQEEKQAAKANSHAQLVAANIVAYLAGRPLKHYKGSAELIAITNGKTGGISYFGVLWGIVLGDWFTAMIKSKGLLVSIAKGRSGY